MTMRYLASSYATYEAIITKIATKLGSCYLKNSGTTHAHKRTFICPWHKPANNCFAAFYHMSKAFLR